MDYFRERNLIIETCLWLQEKELVIGTWGNVSLRLNNNLILVTPSRVEYEEMVPEDLVVVDMAGKKTSGVRTPTSEMHIHRLIYAARPDIQAIIHCHPCYASAMCATGQSIPPILEEMTQLIGGEIPITQKYIRAGEHLALAEETVHALGQQSAVLIANHAPVCCGRSLSEAKICCLVTEKAAKCYLSISGHHQVFKIPDDMVRAEHHRYLFEYGHEEGNKS